MASDSTLKALRNALGQTKLGILITLLVVAAGVFSGSQILPFYYYYYELEGLMHSQAKLAGHFTDDKIRKNVLKKIKEMQIPIESDDALKINRYAGKIVIEVSYQEVFYLELDDEHTYDLWVFHFNPRAEHNF